MLLFISGFPMETYANTASKLKVLLSNLVQITPSLLLPYEERGGSKQAGVVLSMNAFHEFKLNKSALYIVLVTEGHLYKHKQTEA